MDESQNKVKDIGCIVYERDYSVIKYRFLSLIADNDRDKLIRIIKKPLTFKYIIYFNSDNVPVYSTYA